jgi:hypothetical protein
MGRHDKNPLVPHPTAEATVFHAVALIVPFVGPTNPDRLMTRENFIKPMHYRNMEYAPS